MCPGKNIRDVCEAATASSPSPAAMDLAQGQKLWPGRGSYPLREKGNQEAVGAPSAQIMWDNAILPRAEGAMWLRSRTWTAGPRGCALHSENKGEEPSLPHRSPAPLILASSQTWIKLVTLTKVSFHTS